MAVLDKEAISKVVEGSVGIVIHEQLKVIKAELQEKVRQDLLSGYAIDDIRKIQCIIDDATKAGEESRVRLDERINKVLLKVEEAISKIKDFHKEYKESLPDKVFDDLKSLLNSCKQKLDAFRKKLEFIKKSITPITAIQQRLEVNSEKRVFQDWAEKVEVFADALEECFELFPETPLGVFEDFARGLLTITSAKSHETTRKEGYKRRLKYAASFILGIIRKRRYESLTENSAEAKAVRRLEENFEETEWIPVLEAEQDINIDKINTRLKQRGYKIKIPCGDSP